MAYENDHYRKFKSQLSTLQMAKEFMDMARTLRSLKYADYVDLEGQGKIHEQSLSVRLKQSMKDEILEFGALKCENLVVKLIETNGAEFDIRKACTE